ncbi:MAG: helix-turn-helix transcriptional regulator [Clostridia bacterium]|nr:helix-turn-helix transcriptional regulator [Clostridia bacterium]
MNLNFAENLKQLRKEKGVTQEKLSEILGVSAQSVSRWELSICYPDIEMLPAISNYFGVTVDELLSNDTHSKEKDHKIFNDTVYKLSDKTGECIDFIMEYCRKYPESDYYSSQLVYAIKRHAAGNPEKTEKYMPILLKNAQRLLETRYRNFTIQIMTTLCDEKELDKWLDMTPYNSGFSRRYCLVARSQARNDWEEAYIQQGIQMFESFAVQLDERYPDHFGAHKKVDYQKKILKMIEVLGDGKDVLDGWKCFYAYKQLVLSACLFALKDNDEAWLNFDSAIEKCKYVHSLNNEWLDIGGTIFSNIKVNRVWNYAIDEKGEKHQLFGIVRFSYADMRLIFDLLTNPKWAWFNSVRDTQKFKAALECVKKMKNRALGE